MKVVSINIQGFNLFSNEKWFFHPKEVTVTNGLQTNHYLLKPMVEFKLLSRKNKKQVCFEEKIHGLRYSSGYINFNEINNILMELLPEYDTVYTKGNQNYEYLKTVCEQLLPNIKIINVETLNLWEQPMFKNKPLMCLDHFRSGRCSTTHALVLHNWLQSYLPHNHGL